MRLQVDLESWPYKVPFRVSRGAEAALEVIVVTLTDTGGHRGRGEAAGVDYDGETAQGLAAEIAGLRSRIEAGANLDDIAASLPPGGARNALDCALWDLRAKASGRSVWLSAGFPSPNPLVSAITFGIDSDAATAALAQRYRGWPLIKIKVDGQRHIEVVRLVHEICPRAAFIVDPNQAWSVELLNELAPELHSLGVALIEQPVKRGEDSTLRHYRGPVRLAADESLAERGDIEAIRDYYQVVNIKLDKSGGLTEALATARAARAQGLSLMVGCMAGTSLAMAPGMVIGQMAEFVDLDGPLLHAQDRESGIAYDHGKMQLPSAALWG
jgi:L-alanine-DL-glutamate epimerase-like enolase superfamily enzyme